MINDNSILSCPDDGSALIAIGEDRLKCNGCGRGFRRYRKNFVELLPSKFPVWDLSETGEKLIGAEKSYQQIFNQEFRWREKPAGWGDLSAANPGHRSFIRAERDFILRLLNPDRGKIAVDVSGGVGNYSIPLAGRVRALFHCELEPESIQAAYLKSASENIYFVRAAYLRLPFADGVIDYAVCTDTLIRGRNHEKKLLREIMRILKKGGTGVVDFHNARPFIRDRSIVRYRARQVELLLRETGITNFTLYPFGHIPSVLVPAELLYPVMDAAFGMAPCQRHVAVFSK